MVQVNASEHNALLFDTPLSDKMCGAFVGCRHKRTFSPSKTSDTPVESTVCDWGQSTQDKSNIVYWLSPTWRELLNRIYVDFTLA